MTMKMKMWVIVLFLMPLTHSHAQYPAVQTVMSQKGLNGVTQWITGWLQNNISTILLPEVRGNVDIGIGSVSYVLHDMTIKRCDLPETSVVFSEGTGISLKLYGLTISISGLWNTQFGIIHDGGSFELSVYSISLVTMLELGSDEERLTISTVSCSALLGGVQVNFHGGGSFIIQPFIDMFSKRITEEIRQKICPPFEQGIEALEKHLAVMPDAVNVDPYIYMNISLTDSPLVKSSGLGLSVKGEFYSITSPSEPPFSSEHFELPWQEDYMVTVGISEFCMNSAAYAYYCAGVLSIHITEDMLPKISPIHLNTSQFGLLIPQLPKLYPDLPMELELYASKTPLFTFKESVISVYVLASVKAFAIKTDSVAVPLFRLDMESSFSGKAYTETQLLKGALEMNNFTMELGSTEIGEFQTGPIEQMVKLAISTFALPKVNAYLKKGVPLPSVKGFSIASSVTSIENGFLAVALDLNGPSDDWR
ncbi:bactericidal permeability-increasing protein-like [Hoplias malabaricus]|uniref:bactericidal permeability-increasing protein-like n=1 Tax=Hoplias malabaricus TaxID=27720 RepID=UPI0034618840